MPTSKRKRRNLRIFAVLGLMLLVALGCSVWFFLPYYIESRLIPQLARQYSLNPAQVRVRSIGLNGTRLGPMRLDAAGRPVLALRAIQIDYSPLTLMRGCIDKITIDGFEAELAYSSDGIQLSGLSRPVAGRKENAGPRPLEKLLPVKINAVVIQKARTTIHWNNHMIQVPFDFSLNTAELKNGVLTGSGRFTPLDSAIHISMALQSGQAEIILDKSHLVVDRFIDLLDDRVPFITAGDAELNGRATFRVQPIKMTGLSVSARLSAFKISSPDVNVQNIPATGNRTRSTRLAFNMDEKRHIQWQCAPFQLTSPARIQVVDFTGTLDPTAHGWQFNVRARTDIPAQPVGPGRKPEMRFENSITLVENIHGRYTPDDGVEFEVTAAADPMERKNEMFLKLGACKVHSQAPHIELAGNYKKKTLNTRYSITTRKTRADLPAIKLGCPQWSLEGHAAISSTVSIQGQAKLSDAALAFGSTAVKIPEAVFTVQAKNKQNSPISLEGDLHMAGVGIDNLSHGFKSKLFPGMIVLFSMETDRTGTALKFQVPAYQPKDDLNMDLFSSSTAGIVANGRLQAQGELVFKGTSTRSHAHVQIDNGRLQQDGHHIDLSGIFLDLHLDDLMTLSTPPGQMFRIDDLHYGRLNATHLNIDFQIDPGPGVFIKKAGLGWCQGTIHTQSIKITPGIEAYDLTLFCDALNLPLMLEQLEVAKASGQGTVSGRIPLHWTNKGRLSFRKGFLSSLPGKSGTIRISGTDYLLAGLPPDAPQRTQLEIAIEALKDYTFKWAKLHLNSQQDDLLVQLQVEGKPNRLLPFVFDKQLGRFKRVPGQGQADFKGIGIDLNFKSPLNEILQYKELLTPKLK